MEVSQTLHSILGTPLGRMDPDHRGLVALLGPDCTEGQAAGLLADNPGLFGRAWEHGVAPLVAARWGHLIADGQRDRWRRAHLGSVAAAVRQAEEAASILRALTACGVQPIVLRGLWLAHVVYDDPALRPFTDIDLVVPPDSIATAAGVMADLGFSATCEWLGDPWLGQQVRRRQTASVSGVWVKTASDGFRTLVDFHTTLQVAGGWWGFRPSTELLYERSEPWALRDVTVRALRPYCAVLAQCENIVRHGLSTVPNEQRLIGYYDVQLLVRRLSPADWDALLADASRLRLLLAVAAVLEKVREFWGITAPEQLTAALSGGGLRARVARQALARPAWMGRKLPMALFQVCSLHGYREAGRYVVRNLFGELFERGGHRA